MGNNHRLRGQEPRHEKLRDTGGGAGDDRTLKESIDKAAAPTGCSVTELKTSGNQVTVSSRCLSGSSTGVTTHRGDSYDAEYNNGNKLHSKRICACT